MAMSDLDKRDKSTLFFAGLFVLLALFMVFYVPNSWGRRYQEARAELTQKHQELQLAQLEKLEEEERVKSQEELLAILNARDPRFDLFPFINRVVEENGLTDRAKLENGRRPRGLSNNHPLVELELSGVSLEELIGFLYKIRSSNSLVAIYTMDVEPELREQGLRCKITFISVKV